MKKRFLKLLGRSSSTSGQVVQIPVSKITTNPYQPRRRFSESSLNNLARSIKEFGVVQPIIVRQYAETYQLVAGERRLRACKLAGFPTIPALVRQSSDAECVEVAFLENLQRENLDPVEEAETYNRLCYEFHSLNIEEIGKKLGKDPREIEEKLSILRLPQMLKKAISAQLINVRQAKLLAKIELVEEQSKALKKVYENDFSLRETESLVESYLNDPRKKGKLRHNGDKTDGDFTQRFYELEKELAVMRLHRVLEDFCNLDFPSRDMREQLMEEMQDELRGFMKKHRE